MFFGKNFAAAYRSGVCEEKINSDPLPPPLYRGMCEGLIAVAPLYILDIVFGYSVSR